MLTKYLEELKTIQFLTREEEEALWEAFYVKRDEGARIRLIEQYQPLVLREALRMNYGDMEPMELVQEGLVGLMEAVDRYVPDKGIAFPVYAIHRIRGRMIDFLRKEGKKGILFDGDSVGMDRWWNHIPDEKMSIEEQVEDSALSEVCVETLSVLTDVEKYVMKQACLSGVPMKEIAQDMDISESYAYRLQRRATEKIKGFMKRLEWS